MNSTLANSLKWENESNYLELDLKQLVSASSRVIAPYGPIGHFAARSPWAGMEGQTFEETAQKLKDIIGVEIYPDDSMFQSARVRGEINQDFLELKLQQWLAKQSIELPRKVAERFCRNALMLELPKDFLDIPGLKSMAKRLNRFKSFIPESHTVQTFSRRLEQQGVYQAANELNRQLIKWSKLFLDDSHAVWSMPFREEGFFGAWRKLVHKDPGLSRKSRKQLADLPQTADHALMEALLTLEVPSSDWQEYLEAHLLELPGWAGMMLWRSQQSEGEQSLLLEYLAVRISMESTLIRPFLPIQKQKQGDQKTFERLLAVWMHWGKMTVQAWQQLSAAEIKARLTLAYRFDKVLRNQLWLEAWEATYEEQLKKMITLNSNGAASAGLPLAQFVFCIDVRSEPFRRKLEQAGPFETLGTAGFFGLPIETCELGSTHSHNSLPVMFKPQFKINESAPLPELIPFQQRRDAVYSLGKAFQTMKHNLLSSLLLPEISGPWLSFQTLGRSVIPKSAGQAYRKLRKTWLRKPKAELTLDCSHANAGLSLGFSDEEKVHYAREALKMMGLTDHFAPLVVICGHGGHSTNNPYASSLDCGACGGASSGFNARVLAELCNLPLVRKTLADEGIIIPESTVFAAAEHITTLDELHWLSVPELTEAAQEAFASVQAVLPLVSEEAASERIPQLPSLESCHKHPRREAHRFAEDWSEVRPEWGLARNATFIIGKRNLTKQCHLDGRAFLHNYDWRKDTNGAILANIISGPATVAQWINLQYYASTVAPHYYGSGNKTTQTVTGGIGVMQGNASDLLTGLPWQSVMRSDDEAFHAPLRLLVVIQGPKEYVKRLLEQHQEFRQKLQNGWIRLASIDPDGNWESWS